MPQIPITAFPHFSSALRRAIFRGNCRFQEPSPRKVYLCSQVQINGRFRGLVSRQKIRRSIWPWILNILLFLQRLHLNILPVVTQTAPLFPRNTSRGGAIPGFAPYGYNECYLLPSHRSPDVCNAVGLGQCVGIQNRIELLTGKIPLPDHQLLDGDTGL